MTEITAIGTNLGAEASEAMNNSIVRKFQKGFEGKLSYSEMRSQISTDEIKFINDLNLRVPPLNEGNIPLWQYVAICISEWKLHFSLSDHLMGHANLETMLKIDNSHVGLRSLYEREGQIYREWMKRTGKSIPRGQWPTVHDEIETAIRIEEAAGRKNNFGSHELDMNDLSKMLPEHSIRAIKIKIGIEAEPDLVVLCAKRISSGDKSDGKSSIEEERSVGWPVGTITDGVLNSLRGAGLRFLVRDSFFYSEKEKMVCLEYRADEKVEIRYKPQELDHRNPVFFNKYGGESAAYHSYIRSVGRPLGSKDYIPELRHWERERPEVEDPFPGPRDGEAIAHHSIGPPSPSISKYRTLRMLSIPSPRLTLMSATPIADPPSIDDIIRLLSSPETNSQITSVPSLDLEKDLEVPEKDLEEDSEGSLEKDLMRASMGDLEKDLETAARRKKESFHSLALLSSSTSSTASSSLPPPSSSSLSSLLSPPSSSSSSSSTSISSTSSLSSSISSTFTSSSSSQTSTTESCPLSKFSRWKSETPRFSRGVAEWLKRELSTRKIGCLELRNWIPIYTYPGYIGVHAVRYGIINPRLVTPSPWNVGIALKDCDYEMAKFFIDRGDIRMKKIREGKISMDPLPPHLERKIPMNEGLSPGHLMNIDSKAIDWLVPYLTEPCRNKDGLKYLCGRMYGKMDSEELSRNTYTIGKLLDSKWLTPDDFLNIDVMEAPPLKAIITRAGEVERFELLLTYVFSIGRGVLSDDDTRKLFISDGVTDDDGILNEKIRNIAWRVTGGYQEGRILLDLINALRERDPIGEILDKIDAINAARKAEDEQYTEEAEEEEGDWNEDHTTAEGGDCLQEGVET